MGAYGIRRVDNEEVTHPSGTTVIDMSKIKKNVVNEFVSSLIDTTLKHKKLGTVHFAVQWKPSVIPPTVPLDSDMICRMHKAAEQNLTLIAPFSPNGYLRFAHCCKGYIRRITHQIRGCNYRREHFC